MAEWAVEVLNDLVEAALLSLPKDMQARFLRISELLESFGAACWTAARETLGEKLWEMRLTGRDGIGRAIYTVAAGTAVGRTSRVCEKTQKTPRRAIDLALKRVKEIGS